MWHFISEHHETGPARQAEEIHGSGGSPLQSGAAPGADPREETLLGILLRLPATWIR